MVASFLTLGGSAPAAEMETLKSYDGKVATVVTRDDQGRIVRMQEPDGEALDFYYAAGCLDRIVHSDGTVDDFACDAAGNSIPKSFGQKPVKE
jgi:hypothetical protein